MASTALQTLGVTPASLGERYQSASTAYEGATKKVSDSLEQKNAALAPLEQQMKDTRAAAPAAPKLDNVNQQFQYVGMDKGEMNDMLSTMFAFAAIGGAMTRTPMTAALGAFAKGVEGFAKGDMENYKRQRDVFDRNFKSAIAKNQQAISEYKLAYDKHQGDLQGLMNDWRLIAAKHGDSVALAQFEAGNARGAMQHLESLVKMDEQGRRADQQFALANRRLDEAERRSRAALDARAQQFQQRLDFDRQKFQQTQSAKAGKMPEDERKKFDARNDLLTDARQVQELLSLRPQGVGPETMLGDLAMSYYDEAGIPLRAALARLQANYSFGQGGKALTGTERTILAPVTEWRGKSAGSIEQQVGALVSAIEKGNNDLLARYPAPGAVPGAGAPTPPQAPSAAVRQFATEAEAAAAGLASGTKVIINGQSGTWQ